ncbi:hypothetical protein LOTGIDRAFT_73524, partial [Lottia gigantea]
IFLYLARILPIVALLPVAVSNFLGLAIFNTQENQHKLKSSTLFAPFICFRVFVDNDTIFSGQMRSIVEQNIKTCLNVGLRNFIFDVVTERSLGLVPLNYLRELIVPSKYQTVLNSQRKSRAWQYCLEEGVNLFSYDDWIVHLNVGTEMSNNSVISIANFIYDNKFLIGQGQVTCRSTSANVISVMSDSLRIAMDYGMSRFGLRCMNMPLFGVKSTFLLCNAGVENSIGFDFGSKPDMTVENMMVLKAWQQGHKVGHIDCEMYEKETNSVFQFVNQRCLFISEILQTISNTHVFFIYKIGIFMALAHTMLMHFAISYFVLHFIFPLSGTRPFTLVYGFIFGLIYFMNVFGAFKTHSFHIRDSIKLLVLTILMVPFSLLIESSALYQFLFSKQ